METLCCTSVSNSGLSLYTLLSIHFFSSYSSFPFLSPHCACLCCSFFWSTNNQLYLNIWSLWFISEIELKNYSMSIAGCIYWPLSHPLSKSHCWMLIIENLDFYYFSFFIQPHCTPHLHLMSVITSFKCRSQYNNRKLILGCYCVYCLLMFEDSEVNCIFLRHPNSCPDSLTLHVS